DFDGVAALERAWNSLRCSRAFSLMCGYAMDSFAGETLAELFGAVTTEHARVIPTEQYTALISPDERLRAIASLQQQSRTLQAEVGRRKEVEQRLTATLTSERAARETVEHAAERISRLQEITEQLSRSLQADDVLTSIAQSASDLLLAPVGA